MKNPNKVLPQLIVAVWGSWGYFSMGSLRGWSSPEIPSLNGTLDFEVSSSDFQWISSFPMIGAVLGSLFINKPMQYYGRKRALIGHYFIFISGFLITGLTYFGKHKSMLYVGRFLLGFATGCTTPACQIYVSECASPSIRGRLGSLTASCFALGMLITYIIDAFVDWYILALFLGCLPILFLCGTILMPESPVWLLSNGREEEARHSLQILRGKETNIEAELEGIKEHQKRIAQQKYKNQNKSSAKQFRDALTAGPVIKPLGISLGVMLFQQTTGINAIIFYTVSIFQTAGNTIETRYFTIVIDFLLLIFTVASGVLTDRCGRRMLFICSAIATSVPLATMGTFFYFQRQWGDKEATKYLGWLPIVCLIVFFITYSGGMSNVPFIIMGEMFPTQFRSLLGAIASSFHLFCTFVAVYFFPNMLKSMGKDGTFFFFTGCTLLSAIFVYFLLPETKGKTLEDIEHLFSSHNSEQRKSIYRLDDIVSTEITMNGDVILLRRSMSNGSDNSELQLCVDKLEFASAI